LVAYSFKARFAPKIIDKTKAQTIRAHRLKRSRHARAGEELQLYTGMRTKQCKLIRKAECLSVETIRLDFAERHITIGDLEKPRIEVEKQAGLNTFARMDGFADWSDLCAFWEAEHGTLDRFDGVLIRWAP